MIEVKEMCCTFSFRLSSAMAITDFRTAAFVVSLEKIARTHMEMGV